MTWDLVPRLARRRLSGDHHRVTATVTNDTEEFRNRQWRYRPRCIDHCGECISRNETTTHVDAWPASLITESHWLMTLFARFAVLMHAHLSGKLAAGHCQKAPPPTCRQAAA